jgi:hypothetical protein
MQGIQETVPEKYDLMIGTKLQIFDQGELGSSTACAMCTLLISSQNKRITDSTLKLKIYSFKAS